MKVLRRLIVIHLHASPLPEVPASTAMAVAMGAYIAAAGGAGTAGGADGEWLVAAVV